MKIFLTSVCLCVCVGAFADPNIETARVSAHGPLLSQTSTMPTTTTTTTATTAPPQATTISMTTIMDEIGALENQESTTMSQQKTAQIEAIQLQASDMLQGAQQMMQGANMMMTTATLGLLMSMATSAYGIEIAMPAQEGDEAEMSEQSMPVTATLPSTNLNLMKIGQSVQLASNLAIAIASMKMANIQMKAMQYQSQVLMTQKSTAALNQQIQLANTQINQILNELNSMIENTGQVLEFESKTL